MISFAASAGRLCRVYDPCVSAAMGIRFIHWGRYVLSDKRLKSNLVPYMRIVPDTAVHIAEVDFVARYPKCNNPRSAGGFLDNQAKKENKVKCPMGGSYVSA